MKKKFKKLSLSTETLRNLGDSSLKHVAGAATSPDTDCTNICSFCTGICTFCTRGCSECVTCVPCGA